MRLLALALLACFVDGLSTSSDEGGINVGLPTQVRDGGGLSIGRSGIHIGPAPTFTPISPKSTRTPSISEEISANTSINNDPPSSVSSINSPLTIPSALTTGSVILTPPAISSGPLTSVKTVSISFESTDTQSESITTSDFTSSSSSLVTPEPTLGATHAGNTKIVIGIVLGSIGAIFIALTTLITIFRRRRIRSKGSKEKFKIAPYADQKSPMDVAVEDHPVRVSQRVKGNSQTAVRSDSTPSIPAMQYSSSRELRSDNQATNSSDPRPQNQSRWGSNDTELLDHGAELRGVVDRNPSRSLRNAVAMIMDHIQATNGQPEAVVRSMFVAVDAPPPAYS
ncbi:hypothetical protein VKT23_018421 [Stygiomarasmius scandens]|uniref:Mid2 domain-containing protein n=1 Tax=Marasmiellus scandens TaxID=2682957 RepID=A0ABR1IS59_9AGAR